ncbi:MAG: AAA family ATPase [Candidatus Hydrogenedens sp.]|nr:AAA family ATPase [Candidatus Hydrogenedens sp.]
MYESFYGLRERPFNLTPDPKFLYLSEKHKEAFAHLLYGIRNRSGFVMISGEIGTGKTTLCRNLLNQLDSNTEVAFIFNPFLSAIELMKKINQEFGIESEADTVLELTEELNVHLLHSSALGKDCVLVIDEAQNLSPQVLEQIRLLSNLETDSEKLLQIILIGQPELVEKLSLRELRQLNQRITARYHLKSLSADETLQYVAYRIHVAGGRKRINFTKSAVKQVYKLSGGVPRMINALCDRTLLIGYTKEQHVISAKLVKQAAKEIRGEKITAPKEGGARWRRFLPSPMLLLILVVGAVLMHYLVSPLDRFAQELSLFNRILSGEEHLPGENVEGAAAFTGGSPEEKPIQQPVPDEPLRQVLNRLSAVGAGKNAQLLAPVLADLDGEKAKLGGMETLLSLWNRPPAESYPDRSDAETLIQFFESQGLACEKLRSSPEELAAINLPGLVRLHAGDTSCWLGLVRMDQDSVTLLTAVNTRLTTPLKEFALYYAREALFLWKDSDLSGPVLSLGQRGSQVESLKERLRLAGLLGSDNTNDVFDQATEKAVIQIQEKTGLKADGKAGRQVRLVLASFGADTPTLQERQALSSSAADTPSEGASAEKPAISSSEYGKSTKETAARKTPAAGEKKTASPAKKESTVHEPRNIQYSAEQALPDKAESTNTALVEENREAHSSMEVNLLRRLDAPAEEEIPVTEESLSSAAETENSTGLMEVKELPESPFPFVMPESNFDRDVHDSLTLPLPGSSPLLPVVREREREAP